MVDTDILITRLAQHPVGHPLIPPTRRALLWLGGAALLLGSLTLLRGLRPDLAQSLANPGFVLEWGASLMTGILAAIAAFHGAQPDRSSRWMWLPVPGLGLWLGAVLYGIDHDLGTFGPACLHLGNSWLCAGFITLTTLPLGGLLFYLLRYAGPIRPVPTVLLATLSIAALTSCTQSLSHNLTTTLMVLVWHLGTVALLLVPSLLFGPGLLRLMLGRTDPIRGNRLVQ